MPVSDMSQSLIDQFRDVKADFDSRFELLDQYLDFALTREKIRWVNIGPDGDRIPDYSDHERLKKATWGKVQKASPLYEEDTGKKYIVSVNEVIVNAMTAEERRMYLLYLLCQIHLFYSTSKEELQYSTLPPYAAERVVRECFPNNELVKADSLSLRFPKPEPKKPGRKGKGKKELTRW